MIAIWHTAMAHLPFEWAQYAFMRNALLAVLLISTLCGALGTLVVNNRMSFFADSIGHGALAGLAAAVLVGLEDPGVALVLFAVLFAGLLVLLRRLTAASTDTLIAAVTATAVAGGLVVLSRGGGFGRFTRYLIGDVLSITPDEIALLVAVFLLALAVWMLLFNRFLFVALYPSIARSRNLPPALLELVFSTLVAVVIAVAIPWVGLFIISSLLVLPAAAARQVAARSSSYLLASLVVAVTSGVTGLLLSYEGNTAAGATIVLVAAAFFFLSLVFRRR